MKIAMIGHKRIPSREGGVEIVVEELATRMAKLGHHVDAYNRMGKPYSALLSGYDEKRNCLDGVRLITVPTLPINNIDTIVYSVFATIRAIFGRYDVIHYHAEGCCVLLPLPKLFGIRVVATIHGLDWQRSKWGRFASWYLKLGEKIAVHWADELIVLSKHMQVYFEETYHRETVFLPNASSPMVATGGCDIIQELYGLVPEEFILITARLVPEKGIHYAMEAFSRIKTDKKLIIAGDMAYPDEYIRRLQQLAALDDRVILSGFVAGKTLSQLYENCFLFVLPSDLEGMSLSLLEAIGNGCRCLLSDIPENMEVAGDEAAYFQKSNVGALEEALRDILENRRVFPARHQIAENFSHKLNWDEITDKTLEIYRNDKRKKVSTK